MASGSVDFLSDKGYSLSPRSTNHTADIMKQYMHEYKISLQIIKKHGLTDEFVNAVKNGTAIPLAPEEVVVNDYGRATNR